MANELKLTGYTQSSTVTIKLLGDDLVQVGADIATTEPSAGNYLGSMPSAAVAEYSVLFIAGGNTIATGVMNWNGITEIVNQTSSPIGWTDIKAVLGDGLTAKLGNQTIKAVIC